MNPNDPRAKKLSHSLHGFQQAVLRFQSAHWHRPEGALTAVAEAVWWAVSLDRALGKPPPGERDGKAYRDGRGASIDGRKIIGMIFVRNRLDHGSTLLDFVQLNSVVGSSWHGMRAGWVWKPFKALEPLLDPKSKTGPGGSGLNQYRDSLGGHVIEHTLLDANRWFLSVKPAIPALPSDETGKELAAFALREQWPPVEGDRRA